MPHRQLAAPAGSPPGTLHIDPDAVATRLSVIAYGPTELREEVDVDLDRVEELHRASPVTWIDVTGLGTRDILQGVAASFGLHPLVLEDILHVRQRPKVEEYQDYNFIVVRMLRSTESAETEQLSIVLEKDCVITFQEQTGDCLDPVRQRLRNGLGRIRGAGAGYLAYALIDAVVDHYGPHLDWYSERIERLEEEVIVAPSSAHLGEIYDLKHDLLGLRRNLLPMRDAIGRLHREEVPLFSADVAPYLRDCYDHSLRLIENLEVHREGAGSLMDLYMSSTSHKMNEVMKVLTIMATIFIPLSFITGLYGMNFDPSSPWNMPELTWRLGYPFALAIMAVVAIALLVFFRRRGWLGGSDRLELPRRHRSDGAP